MTKVNTTAKERHAADRPKAKAAQEQQQADRLKAKTEHLEAFKSDIADNDKSMRSATEHLLETMRFGTTQREAADAVGKSASWINRLLKWAKGGYAASGPFSAESKAKRKRAAKDVQAPEQPKSKPATEDKRHGIGGNHPPADEPVTAPVTGSATTEISHEAAKARYDLPADGSIPTFKDRTGKASSPVAEPPAPAELTTNGDAANGKPDDDRPLAEKLHYALNDAWSLCQDKNNWPPLSAAKERELRGAMKKIAELRELLPRLATPKSKQLH